MPVLYTSTDKDGNDHTKALIPAPFVSISKSYDKTGDGKKVGATYSITLEGTILPHKGSPMSDGSWHEIAGTYPVDESISEDEVQYSLFKKTSAIRKLFATEGKELYIYTWKKKPPAQQTGSASADFGNMGIMCYPRITSVDIGDNRYIGPIPYTITLECDEIFHTIPTPSSAPSPDMMDDTSLGEEDFKTAGVNIIHEKGQPFHFLETNYNKDISWGAEDTTPKNGFADNWPVGPNNSFSKKVYLRDINEDWSVEMTDQKKFRKSMALTPGAGNVVGNQLPTFTVTHTLSATGKRAYGPDPDGTKTGTVGRACLLREPWANGKIWVDERLGPVPNYARPSTLNPRDYTPVSELDSNFENPTPNSEFLFDEDLHGFSWDRVIFPSPPPFSTCDGTTPIGHHEPTNDGIAGPTWRAYNYKRSTNISKVGGTYGITETFLLVPFFDANCDNNVIEDMTFEISFDHASNVYTVTVNGAIIGLENRYPSQNFEDNPEHQGKSSFNIYEPAYDAANRRFTQIRPGTGVTGTIYIGANGFLPANGPGGEDIQSLRQKPISETISRNIPQGTINYSYVFNTRTGNFAAGDWVPMSESLTITDNHAAEKFAEHAIPGRSSGPILQCLGTKSTASRTVAGNVTMPVGTPAASFTSAAASVSTAVEARQPGGTVYKTADSENVDIIAKTYSRSITWTFNE